MRAEEGNESLRDYAVEGEQTLGKIKESQRARSPIGRLVSRIAKVFRG
jgi:hypothetical protein